MSAKDHTAQFTEGKSENPATWLKPDQPLMAGGYDWSWCYVWFKDIEWFPGYRVGHDGSFWSCLRQGKGCRNTLGTNWRKLKFKPDKDSYLTIGLRKDRKYHWVKVHRVVLNSFIGPAPKGTETRHLNGNRQDNRLDNLRWGTSSENRMDCYEHGSKVGPWKLSLEEAKEILRLSRTGNNRRALAQRYGVHCSTIKRILTGGCLTLNRAINE